MAGLVNNVVAAGGWCAAEMSAWSVSVSGFSAGGFMAAQLGVAYACVFGAGFGVFAGGPYDCARHQDFQTVCLGNHTPAVARAVANMRRWGDDGRIDDPRALAGRRVYLQCGAEDAVVGVATTRQLGRQLAEFVRAEQMVRVETPGAAHAFPTHFDAAGNSRCGESRGPYIANCGYDGAGAVLQWLYGPLAPPTALRQPRPVQPYAQTGPFGARGLAHTGFLYLPEACRHGGGKRPCRLHVALHGCTMSYEQIGDRFIQNTGYLAWAEANDLVVLFPQATRDPALHKIWNGTAFPGGALACFDWVGWVGENADQKGGVQMEAIVNMVKQLTSTHGHSRHGHSKQDV